jgi:hypothetical protein
LGQLLYGTTVVSEAPPKATARPVASILAEAWDLPANKTSLVLE